MAIDKNDLLKLRPCAYHTCSAHNYQSIRAEGRLLPASTLLEGGSIEPGRHRKESVTVRGAHGHVVLRDHRQFALGAVEIEGGGAPTTYIGEQLDGRVFFWPGDQRRPIATGRRHYEKYCNVEPLVVIRVSLGDLLACNPSTPFEVTRCNSGSARKQYGHKVLRGPSIFQTLDRAPWRVRQVIEFTFRGPITLPLNIESSPHWSGPWMRVWPANQARANGTSVAQQQERSAIR